MDLPDDNAAMVTHLSPSTYADVLSLIRRAQPVVDDIEEGDLTWCAAGLESLQSVTWDRVREATSSNGEMRMLEEMAVDGFPESRIGMPQAIRGFHQYHEDVTSTDGVVLYRDRVVILPSLRDEVLGALHAAHQGAMMTVMMTARAESSVFWPGMSADICATRSNCEHCHRMAPSQPTARLTPPILAVYPFQAVCSDFSIHRGVHYLVTVDRYSNCQSSRGRRVEPPTSYAIYAMLLPHTGLVRSLHQTGGRSSPLPRPGLSFADGACTTVSL